MSAASGARVDAMEAVAPPVVRRTFYQRNISRIRALESILVVFVIWELTGRFLVKDQLFWVPFSAVLAAFPELWRKGELQLHVWTSFVEFVLGYGLAAAVGILLGLAMAVSRRLRDYFDPWVSLLYATPLVALAPLLILWFKLGIESKVAVIFLMVVFPVLLNTVVGVQGTEPHLIEAARSFGARPVQIFTKVMLPSALPVIITGLRQGVARGLVGVVVAELFGSKAGLGFLILNAAQIFDTAQLFVGVIILALAGVVGAELLKLLERRLAPWRRVEAEE